MKRRHLVVRTWLGICLTVLTVGAAADALPPRMGVVTLDIKSQPIGAALNEFGQQSGIQVLFYSDVANGLSAPALVGTFTPDVALTQLLSNTGLTYSYVNTRTVAIHRVVSTASEGKATRREAGRPVMRLANDLQTSEKPNNGAVAVQQTGSQEVGREVGRQNSDEQRRRNTRMEEVIVTARKRTERLQDVPLSVTAITAEEIDRRGLVSAEDYLRGIPGVNQVGFGHEQSIVIRGVETSPSGQNFSSGTTVATYFGETPTTNSAGVGGNTNVDIKLVDIERVEVLRGPQGTAFGSSSLGGAVRTIPAAPKLDRIEGKVAADYSLTSGAGGDNYMGQAVLNIPLVKDKLAIRAVAYRYEDTGFYRNVAGSDPAFQAGPVATYGAQAFATDEDHAGTTRFTGGRIAALFQANDDLRFTLSYLKQNNEMDGAAFSNTGTFEHASFQVAPEHIDHGRQHGFADTHIALTNAMMEYNFGWADLLATYSYTKSGTPSGFPATTVGQRWPYSTDSESEHREHSGEVRLTTQLDGAWNFLAGLYGEEQDDVYNLTSYWFGNPATNPFDPNLAGVVFDPQRRFLGAYHDSRNLKQKAAFGEASWEFLRGFTLTSGVRTYKYDRTVDLNTNGAFYNQTASTAAADASGTSFRANLSYKPRDNALVYASWSQGFRLGRPQPGLAPGLCDRNGDGIVDGTSNITIDQTRRLASDEVDNYELGSKFSLFDRRLIIAADVYRIDWTGVPFRVLAPRPPDGCGFAYNANAGAARSEGIEFQANLYIADAFRVDVGSSWIRAKLTEDAPGVGGFKDDRLPGSPKVNANLSFQYEFDIGGSKAFVRADSIYIGTFFGNVQESANTESGGYVKVDATGGVTIGNVNLGLFGHNLTNRDDFTWRGGTPRGDFYGYRLGPRTVGLRLGYSFE